MITFFLCVTKAFLTEEWQEFSRTTAPCLKVTHFSDASEKETRKSEQITCT